MKTFPGSVFTTLAAFAPLALAVVACSGSTVSPLLDGGAVDAGNPNDGAIVGDATADACTSRPSDPAGFCTLYNAKPNTALTLQVREQCGSVNAVTRCNTSVSDKTITLQLISERCGDGTLPEPAVCGMRAYDCLIPALPAGVYSVQVKGAPSPPGTGVPERLLSDQLIVTDDGTQSTCALGHPDAKPPSIDPATYNQACALDTDCTLVQTGDVCSACCPGGAIAKSDATKYANDLADKRASCERVIPQAPCACAQAKASCVDNKCKLVPGG